MGLKEKLLQRPTLQRNSTMVEQAEQATKKASLQGATRLRTYMDAVVVITGRAPATARPLAEELSKRGARAVVLVDRQTVLADEVADGLRNNGTEAKAYEVDARESYGHLDLIFNNAGILVGAPLEEIGVDDGTNSVQATYSIMTTQGFGRIVNTAPITASMATGEGFVAWRGVNVSAVSQCICGLPWCHRHSWP
jgi:NADP-dependent 3-hydroxy acid dehydrogenase YdfG